mmetsp:Transcript_887/g.1081  ORF Transcript_887/g.1081 Transcript_887/m.1081 type:complete len:316 (+) Transcript_887:121-1068(+)|eukprot:CAMPEP_0184021970 /NCGR_PEP_ID=MMETSP0954-20121128/10280_1 /TAXON_ID=627963 /ORGANISM="Aplanochytrium sp, Strain PBS07" /LENGTH=315 /DNA_ID=CAMNT_0026304161 /DNA_START=56 /DNA_END=1003 /DNA_ORIENTATION=-
MKSICRNWWQFSARSRFGHFGSYLGLRLEEDGGGLKVLDIDKRKSQVYTKVPQWCFNEQSGELYVSAALALFDEISTYSGVCSWDRQGRPGVSISLSAKRLQPLILGKDRGAIVTTKFRKIGRTVGFADIVVSSAEKPEEKLLVGQHVKFLPMGFGVSAATSHLRNYPNSPITTALMKLIHTQPIQETNCAKKTNRSQIFNLQNVRNSVDEEGFFLTEADLALSTLHANPIGNLHGGAAGMVSAMVSELAIQGCTDTEHVQLDHISVSLLSPTPVNKKNVTVQANACKDSNGNAVSEAIISQHGNPTVTSVMTWC